MIRRLKDSESIEALQIINEAALVYKNTIPNLLYREPWMDFAYFKTELQAGVKFFCYEKNGKILGVMGIQKKLDVILIRHSYVRLNFQNQKIGSRLLQYHQSRATLPILVGCLESMTWAIQFYEKNGFTLVSKEICKQLREKYWNLSAEHVQNSVVLGDNFFLNVN